MGLSQHRQINAEATIGRLAASHRLEHQINRCTAFDQRDGIGHMRQYAALGGNFVALAQIVEHG